MNTKQTEALKLALEALVANDLLVNGDDKNGGLAWCMDGYYDGCFDIEAVNKQTNEAITTIREALADSALDRMAENARELGLDYGPIVEQVEDFVGMGHKAWDMVDPKELAKGFHEALAEPPCKTGSQCTNKCQQCDQPRGEATLAPVAPPHKQQEPVGKVNELFDEAVIEQCGFDRELLVYTSPPIEATPLASQRSVKPWVGLTEKEKLALVEYADEAGLDDMKFIEDIEAKLKEKNAWPHSF